METLEGNKAGIKKKMPVAKYEVIFQNLKSFTTGRQSCNYRNYYYKLLFKNILIIKILNYFMLYYYYLSVKK